MGQLSTLETTDFGFVFDGIRALEAKLFSAPHLGFPLCGRQGRLRLERFHALEAGVVGQGAFVLTMIGGVPVIKSHVIEFLILSRGQLKSLSKSTASRCLRQKKSYVRHRKMLCPNRDY